MNMVLELVKAAKMMMMERPPVKQIVNLWNSGYARMLFQDGQQQIDISAPQQRLNTTQAFHLCCKRLIL